MCSLSTNKTSKGDLDDLSSEIWELKGETGVFTGIFQKTVYFPEVETKKL